MTRVILNGTIKGLRGRMVNMIFRQMPDGTTVVTSAPVEKNRRQKKRAKARRSTRQKAHNERFEEASYARRAAKAEPLYRELAAVTPMKTAYNFALSDWFSAPEVRLIERQEGCIRVKAFDKVFVSRVQITILNGEGEVLEQAEAVRGEGNWWEFAPTVNGKTIIAEAWDLAGNAAKAAQ